MRRLIRRYSNRKLYDTTISRYVTLSDVAALVRMGEELQIVEHGTGREITSAIFAEILFEEEKRNPKVTVEQWQRIIRYGLRD